MTVFEESILVTVLAKLVSLFFKNVLALFSFFFFSFLTRSLIDRCQIVTDTCIITFQSLFGSLLNHFYPYANENVLFNLRHLYFNYHLLIQKLLRLRKILLYLQPKIIRVLSEWISLSLKNKYINKICHLPAKGWSVWWKAVTSALKMLPSAYGLAQHFQDLGHSFSPYGPPSRQITYIYSDIDRLFPYWTVAHSLQNAYFVMQTPCSILSFIAGRL